MNFFIINFAPKKIRLLFVDEKANVILIDELPSSIKFEEIISQFEKDNFLVTEIAEQVQYVISNNKLNVSDVGILIDSSLAFINLIPIDSEDDKLTLNSHIMWELSNYFPESYLNYVINYYKVENKIFPKTYSELLLIAIEKNKIEFIKEICRILNFKINLIDIDFFSFEKCVFEVYKNSDQNKNILLIGYKKEKIEFGLYCNEKLNMYDYYFCCGKLNENNIINKIRKFINAKTDLVNEVFIYGDANIESFKKLLEVNFENIPIKIADPFFNRDNTIINSDLYRSKSMFAPLMGLFSKASKINLTNDALKSAL